jgi:uncharacterized protein (DUF885 family)
MKLLLFCCLGFFIVTSAGYCKTESGFSVFSKKFVDGIREINPPSLQLSYVENLKHISSSKNWQKQFDFFRGIQKELSSFSPKELTASERIDFYLIAFETGLNLERLSLEKRTGPLINGELDASGIYRVPAGKEWYAYFLKRWTASDAIPDSIYAAGIKELEAVKNNVEDIRRRTGLDQHAFYAHLREDSFYFRSEEDVRAAFEQTKTVVLSNLSRQFILHDIPDVAIRRGTNEALAQTPGYYTENVFYYNYFDSPYNKRQVDWLFIHEAIPGHHFQISIADQLHQSDMQNLFHYSAFSEGWAAYTETLGKEIGLYRDIYSELGKWEWDLVRSVRVPLDIGLNYYGWTDDQALAFWKKNVINQDDIAMREINRLKRWPAQAISYKYGAARINDWKNKMKAAEGDRFDVKQFHEDILRHGSLPFFIIQKIIFKDI